LNLKADAPVEGAAGRRNILIMKSVPLNAFPRTQARRGGVKKLRDAGRLPAVIYGRQQEPQSLEITFKDMENLIHHSVSENLLVDLAVAGDARPKRLALVQEVQHHPLSGKMLHVDLHEVAENEKVTIMVPVETEGEATGVKNGGGVLEHVLFKIKARALPKDLPEAIVVDVSHLEIGRAIHIGDIKPQAGVEILGDKHISVIAVAAPISEAQEAAATEAAVGATGEVEMIKEKKEDGTEGAAPAKAGEKAAPGAKAGDKAAAPAGAAKAGEKAAAPAKGAEKKK
jgi:large subunit ribosomal protein L25